MPVVAIVVGFGCGMLLAAMGFSLWSGLGEGRTFSRGARAVAWGAAAVLVIGALLAWGSGLPALKSLAGPVDGRALGGCVLSLILMAALAVPLSVEAPHRTPWSHALLYLPASVLASLALVQMTASADAAPGADWVTPIHFSLAVCGGLGARAMAHALRVMVVGMSGVEWPGSLAYGLITLLAGSAALVNLWQRGRLWVGADPVLRGGIGGAWLAWSAYWLAGRRHARLRAALTIVAALLLVLVAIKPA
ncbi:MAG: hypothetical protein PVH50_09230 [Anaerolineae bacterium]|jgi:hypothetical protein